MFQRMNENIKEYQQYMLSLEPDEVIQEYFLNLNDHNLKKINENVTEANRRTKKEIRNFLSVQIIEIKYNTHRTQEYSELLRSKGETFYEIKGFDVTYDVEYRIEYGQGSGTHTWGYYMIKKNADAPWLIGFMGY
jgi:hypothetical protein